MEKVKKERLKSNAEQSKISPRILHKGKKITEAYRQAYNITTGNILLSVTSCKALIQHNAYNVIMFYDSQSIYGILAKGYVNDLINKFDGLTIGLFDIKGEKQENYQELFEYYGITSLPYVCLVKAGKIESSFSYLKEIEKYKKDVTYMEKETEHFKEWLKEYLFVY